MSTMSNVARGVSPTRLVLLVALMVAPLVLLLCASDASSQTASESYEFVTKWGSGHSGEKAPADGQFGSPFGIAVDPSGNVYVADTNNNRIQKFTSNGGFVTKWGTQGTGDGQFDSP